MSLVVEIRAVDNDKDLSGLTSVLRGLVESLGTGLGNATFNALKNTVCRGILQNNIDISFTNKWDSTVYQGVMSGVNKLSQTADTGTWGNWGKAIMAGIDFAQAGLNMGGMSMIGTGAASTKMYGGSNITGLTVSLKWYTPQASKSIDGTGGLEYQDSLKALVALGFPSQRNAASRTKINADKLGGKSKDDTETKNKIAQTIETLFSINPPPVKLTIKNGNTVIYNIHPLVITNITLNSSRETLNGIPIVVGANVSFDFFQIKGNGGYVDEGKKLKFAGIDLLDKIVSADNNVTIKNVVNGNPDKNEPTTWNTISADGSKNNRYNKFEKDNQIVVREVGVDKDGNGIPGTVVNYTENTNASSVIPYMTIESDKETTIMTKISDTVTKLDVTNKVNGTKTTLTYTKLEGNNNYKVKQQTYTKAGIATNKPIDVLPELVKELPVMPSEKSN